MERFKLEKVEENDLKFPNVLSIQDFTIDAVVRRQEFTPKLLTVLCFGDALSLLPSVYAREIRSHMGQSVKCIFGR